MLRVIENMGLTGLVDGEHFFDMLADDVVFDFVISVITVANRKIAHWRDYLDPLRVFAALQSRAFEPDD
jgi:limonene-1,2-epoxide hydrolase